MGKVADGPRVGQMANWCTHSERDNFHKLRQLKSNPTEQTCGVGTGKKKKGTVVPFLLVYL